MDNFNLAPVTVWALSAVKRVRLTLKWQLLAPSLASPNAGRSNFLPNSLSYQQFQRKLKNG